MNRYLPSIVVLTSLALPGAGSHLAAQTLPADEPVVLDELVVEDRPVAIGNAMDDFGTVSTEISRAQLDSMNAGDLASALQRTPGAATTTYNRVGAFGGAEGGAVFLRGLGSSRPGAEIKTLIDGVPMLNGVFNHPLLDLMPVDVAESIQVYRRAAPLAVGNAFAAVNIVPMRLQETGMRACLDLSAGTDSTFGERFNYAQNTGAVDFTLSQSYRRSDGHRPDADGRTSSQLARVGVRVAENWNVNWMTIHTDNRGTDPGPEGVTSGSSNTCGEQYFSSGWLHALTVSHIHDALAGSVRLFQNTGKGDWLRRAYSGQSDSINRWRQQGLRWNETFVPWSGGKLLGGVDLDWTRAETTSVPVDTSATVKFGPETFRLASAVVGFSQSIGQDNTGPGAWTFSAGVRGYDHSEFGSIGAPQAGVHWKRGATGLHAGYSRGVSYPGLEVAALAVVANPALGESWRILAPERAHQFEIGWSQDWSRQFRTAVSLFANDVRDRYVIIPPPPPPPRFDNLERLRTRGCEVSIDWRAMETLAFYAAVTGLDTDPDDVPYAPEWSGTAGLAWTPARDWRVSADVQALGSHTIGSQARTAGSENTTEVGGYALVNVRASRRIDLGRNAFARSAHVWLAIENLLDRDYQVRPGYPMPGISPTLGCSLEW